MLARIRQERCSYEPMALLDNRRDDGIENKISLASCGSGKFAGGFATRKPFQESKPK